MWWEVSGVVGGEWCDVVMWEVAHVSGVTHTLLLPNCNTY